MSAAALFIRCGPFGPLSWFNIILTVHFCSDADNNVLERAASALNWITRSAEDAQDVIKAGVLSLLQDLLQSPNSGAREWTCELLGKLMHYEPDAVLEANPCTALVILLRWVPFLKIND